MRTWSGAAFALLSSALVASAQGTTLRISGAPACDSCRLEVARIFSVGAIPNATPARDARIARDSAGHYLVVVEPGPRIARVDSAGQFIAVLDWRPKVEGTLARNVTVRIDRDGVPNIYDGRSWARLDTAGGGFRVGVLDDYLVMGTGPMGVPVSITRPASSPHRTFATGHWQMDPTDTGPWGAWPDSARRSARPNEQFAVDSVISNPACRACADLVLDVSFGFQKGTVWTAMTDRYRIDLFHNWGRYLTQAVEITDSWLPLRPSEAYAPGRMLPEAPRMTALVFDRNVCTYQSGVPSAATPRDSPCERYLWVSGLTMADSSATDERQRYSTVIDVVGVTSTFVPRPNHPIPLQGARVIARLRLPGRVEMFGPGLAYERRERGDGRRSVDVYRLALKGRD